MPSMACQTLIPLFFGTPCTVGCLSHLHVGIFDLVQLLPVTWVVLVADPDLLHQPGGELPHHVGHGVAQHQASVRLPDELQRLRRPRSH